MQAPPEAAQILLKAGTTVGGEQPDTPTPAECDKKAEAATCPILNKPKKIKEGEESTKWKPEGENNNSRSAGRSAME